MPSRFGFLLLLALFSTPFAHAQQAVTFPEQVGLIDFFGYAGIPLQAVRDRLPVHPGDHIKLDQFPNALEAMKQSILQTTGHPPTDIDVVCCDQNQHMILFIGLQGQSTRRLHLRDTPSGSAHLDPAALKLYNDDLDQLATAVTSGEASEDDSNGYTLTNYPAAKAVQLQMLSYAATRTGSLVTALHQDPDPKDRQAAAMLLGYVPQSSAQLAALNFACDDPDAEVRNNALRALAVLASGPHPPPVNLAPLIDLLYSGTWSDRNKASFFLAQATQSRDPVLLKTLRDQALPPLLEGAAWSSSGHAYAFLTLLARMEGLPETTLAHLDPAQTASILHAAEALNAGHTTQ